MSRASNNAPALLLVTSTLESDRRAFAAAAVALKAKLLPSPGGSGDPIARALDCILGLNGYTPTDPRPVDFLSLSREQQQQARQLLRETLVRHVSTAGPIQVALPPTGPKLLPLWTQVCEELGIRPRFVHVFRSFAETAALTSVDSPPSSYNIAETWRQTVTAFDLDTKGQLRSVVPTGDLSTAPVSAMLDLQSNLDFTFDMSPERGRSALELAVASVAAAPSNLPRTPDWASHLGNAALRKSSTEPSNVAENEAGRDRLTASDAVGYVSQLHLESIAIQAELGRTKADSEAVIAAEEHLTQLQRDLDRLKKSKQNLVHRMNLVDRTFRDVHGRIGDGHDSLSDSIDGINEALIEQQGRLDTFASVDETNSLRTAIDERLPIDEHETLAETVEAAVIASEQQTNRLTLALGAINDQLDELSDQLNTRLPISEHQSLAETVESLEIQQTADHQRISTSEQQTNQLAQTLDTIRDQFNELSERLESVSTTSSDSVQSVRSSSQEFEMSVTTRLQAIEHQTKQTPLNLQRSIAAFAQDLEKETELHTSRVAALETNVQQLADLPGKNIEMDSSLRSVSESAEREKQRLDILETSLEKLHAKANELPTHDWLAQQMNERMATLSERFDSELATVKSQHNYEFRRVLEQLAVNNVLVQSQQKHAQPTGSPTVSIIIPAFNHAAETLRCLHSIEQHRPRASFEVIVANDASTEPGFDEVRSFPGVRVVDMASNGGFGPNCNNAASSASGEFLYFLNNDAQITSGAIDALVETFTLFPNTGIAGSKLLFPDLTVQDAGGIIWRDGTAWNYGRTREADDPRHSYCRIADYVAGASLLIRRQTFEELGGFDDLFAPAYYEDTDLCMKVAKQGLEVRYQPQSVVIHDEGTSYGTDVREEGKHHQLLNSTKFFERWRADLASHSENGDSVEFEKERHIDRRILVLDARLLTPDQDSGSLRMTNLLRILTLEGHKVTFLPMDLAESEQYGDDLRRAGVETITRPHVHSVEGFLRARGQEFDVVVLSRVEVADQHLDEVEKFCGDARIIFDTVDLHFLRKRREVELAGETSLPSSYFEIYEAETDAMRRADATLVVSSAELELLRSEPIEAEVHLVSNVHSEPISTAAFADREDRILFVGGFEHPPNADGVQWFEQHVLAHILEEHPEAMVDIIGSKMTDGIRRLAGPRLQVHGQVSDLAPFYDRAKVAIAPIRYGAGVKGKVSQAFARGLPVVATTAASEGMPVQDGTHFLHADEATLFAGHVVELLRNQELWERLRSAGLACVADNYSFEAVGSRLLRALADPTAPQLRDFRR